MKRLLTICTVALLAAGPAALAQQSQPDFDDGKGKPFVSVPHVVKSTGDVMKDWAQSRHAKSFQKNFIVPFKDGGFMEANCFLQCHSSVKILQDKDAQPQDFVKGAKYDKQRYGLTCAVCHEMTVEEPGIKTRNAGWEKCTTCHFAEHRNAGVFVHHASKEMFFGYKLGDVEMKPNTHSTVPGMDCTSCHKVTATDHTFMPERDLKKLFDQPLCKTCHADPVKWARDTEKKLAAFKKRIDTLYTGEFKPILNAAAVVGRLKEGKPADADAFIKDYKAVMAQFSIVQRERAYGLHNFATAQTLLDYSEPRIHDITRKYADIIKKYGTGNRDF